MKRLSIGFSLTCLLACAQTADLSGGNAALDGDKDHTALATPSNPAAAPAIVPVSAVKVPASFWSRFAKAYWDDWHPKPTDTPPPAFRGDPAPVSSPPYPFTVWPIGGTVNIGQPFSLSSPLMTALYGGSDGDAWKRSGIVMYGWANVGMNFSTSSQSNGKYANAPASYAQIPNTLQLDQFAFYIERQPDTVQRDHIDWGFRLTSLYGLDYRFTTAKGYISGQLLKQNADGTIGNKYGYDPVMAYVDLYLPKVAEGMNIRVGRYVSLPDIEAQLAPNNYTYTHSLLYTYDCYTQTGINATTRFNSHWTLQVGLSPGCDTAPWKKDAKLTANACLGYTWAQGGDNVYACANSLNDSRYAYNNLSAYYLTWYHKINSKWHTATESWYQYMKDTPNVNNPKAASLIELNSNGAVCKNINALTCYAPEWSVLNYTTRQLGGKDFIVFRNEYFDDIVGQRTGTKTKYVETGFGWNHWVGTSILFRPEVRWEHAFNGLAYNGGTRHSQFMMAGDVIFFF